MSKNRFKSLFEKEAQSHPDQRRFDRITLNSAVTVFDGERRREGRVCDISGCGARVSMNSELEALDGPPEKGRYIDMDIENVKYIGAQVVRQALDGFAVRFDLDDDESRNLAIEIAQHHAGAIG